MQFKNNDVQYAAPNCSGFSILSMHCYCIHIEVKLILRSILVCINALLLYCILSKLSYTGAICANL